MNTWIHNLLQELESKLVYLDDADALNECKHANAKLSAYMKNYIFLDRAEEILYFKIFKPRFMALQLLREICISGENMESGAIPAWFRDYYESGQSKTDARYFTLRTCLKTDFTLGIEHSSLYESCDKMVARLIVEEWIMQKETLKQTHGSLVF